MAETSTLRPAAASVRNALREATRRLADASQTPRLDAELLLAEVLRCRRERLILDRERVLERPQTDRFFALLSRRLAHEPIAYLLGRQHFRHLTLAVDPRVLIPRPETELLVEVALGLTRGASVLDLGTGSGAVALAVKDERPDLDVMGVDISAGAIDLARANALDLGLDVSFTVGDLLTGRSDRQDAVLANLPYVPDDAPLMDDVACYEPSWALRGGGDGLDVIRRLVGMLAARPTGTRPGLLALEIGSEQGADVAELVRGVGYDDVQVLGDLAGFDRCVIGR